MVLTGPLTLQLTRQQGEMPAADLPVAVCPRCFVHSLPVSCRQFAGSKSLLPFLGTDAMPGIAFPRSVECYRSVPRPRFPTPPDRKCSPAPRYCALLRLPPSVPVGPLCAPFRYPGLTRCLCPSRLPPGSAQLMAAAAPPIPGVVCAGHPLPGCCSQGDGRLSRVPGLPFCPHAPLSDPGGVPLARHGASRTAALPALHWVGFGFGCPNLSLLHDYT